MGGEAGHLWGKQWSHSDRLSQMRWLGSSVLLRFVMNKVGLLGQESGRAVKMLVGTPVSYTGVPAQDPGP